MNPVQIHLSSKSFVGYFYHNIIFLELKSLASVEIAWFLSGINPNFHNLSSNSSIRAYILPYNKTVWQNKKGRGDTLSDN